MKWLKVIIAVVIIFILAFFSYHYLQHQTAYPSTDDAYVQANVIQIAPQVSGQVTQVFVKNHSYVQTGEPLFTIDPASYQLAVEKAQANRDQIIQEMKAANAKVAAAQALIIERQAELLEAEQNAKRILTLVKQHIVSQSEGDDVTSKLSVAQAAMKAATDQLAQAQAELGELGDDNANVRAAVAALATAKLDLKHTTITAPTAGYIINLELRTGSQVTQFEPQFALIEDGQWWVDANFKETQLNRVRINQLADIQLDMYPGHIFKGQVQSISSGSGASFALLPPENATGNWVKVTQRFPVKVVFLQTEKNFPLRMGASATVTIDTTK